jgi:hypothetical protein
VTDISVDFRGITPAQGSSGTDKIPRGLYLLKIAKLEPRTTNGGQPSVRASLEVAKGSHAGARLNDEFVLGPSANGNRFGAQRFMAFLLAFGVPVKQEALRFDGDRVVGRTAVVDVIDGKMPASKELGADGRPKYAEREISRPDSYYNLQNLPPEVKERLSATPGAPPITAQQAEPTAVVADEVPSVSSASDTVAFTPEPPKLNGATSAETTEDEDIAKQVDELFK